MRSQRENTGPDAAVTRRKADHLKIAAGQGVQHGRGTGLERYRLAHRALPERDLDDVDLRTTLLGAELAAPLVVSAMTGGTPQAGEVNRRLARAATEHGLALVLGSGRPLLDDPDLIGTYIGPDRPPLLLANIGAAQLVAGDGPARAERIVSLLEADGIVVHLNAVQEAIQPEGEPFFKGVSEKIAATVQRLAPLPVVVKEVGFGMDAADVRLLHEAGVAAVDVAGAGGTNWALIEGRRDPAAEEVADAFADWGVPTADAVAEAVLVAGDLPVIASGGLRHGVDAAKTFALGATAAGLARPFLLAALAGDAHRAAERLIRQLRIAVWAAGAASPGDLTPGHLRSDD
jgi:isopentenyl-diphosphate delta-isomerase